MWQLHLPSSSRFLHPGEVYTFGRSTSGSRDAFIALESSSVSRNHLTVTVKGGDKTAPSRLVIVDLESRFGSKIDGVPLKGMKEITSTALELTMGTFKAKLNWLPRNICFSTGETGQAHEVMWKHAKNIFDPLDIRLTSVIDESTTHFMRGTKSTSRLLYALVMGIQVVSTRIIDAIGSTGLADGKWPDDRDFLQNEAWAINPRRRNCLDGQRFWCLDEEQYKNLKVAVEGAGGALTMQAGDGIQIASNSRSASGEFVTLDELLAAVVEIRHVKACSKAPDIVRTRPQKAGFLGHMMAVAPTASGSPDAIFTPNERQGTKVSDASIEPDSCASSPSQNLVVPESNTQPGTQRQRPQRHNMLDHLVGSSLLTQESMKRVSTGDDGAAAKRPKADHKRDHSSSSPDLAQNPALKRPRLEHNENDDFSLDTSMACMAIVECSLELKQKVKPHNNINSEKYAGRANFKAFKKKPDTRPKMSQSIKLDVWGEALPARMHTKQSDEQVPEAEISGAEDVEEENEFSFQFS